MSSMQGHKGGGEPSDRMAVNGLGGKCLLFAQRRRHRLLAVVRGLQVDLAVSGDQRRVDAAMHRYIDMITRTDE